MAASKIKKRQIENLAIVDADVAAGAGIVTSKLADGSNFLKREAANNTYYTASEILDMGTKKIINLGAPVAGTDAARLVDVQNAQTGISGKDSVRAATTANLATMSGPATIDGVSIVVGDRVLVKNQTSAKDNGIYVCAVGTWPRANDANDPGELKAGSFVFVTEGTVNADSGWLISTDGNITIDTTAINWVQFSGAGQIIAGAGLTKTGNTLDIGTASASRIVVNADSIDLATVVTANTNCNLFNFDAYGRVTSASAAAYLTIAANRITRETPSGTKNGTNTGFILAFTPTAGTEEVFLNGLLQEPGSSNDYTIAGNTITMITAPAIDDKLVVSYFK